MYLALPYPRGNPGIKTPKTTRNAKFTSKSRQTAKNGGCAAKCTLHFLKNKGFGGSPYVYLKVLQVPYLQMRGVRRVFQAQRARALWWLTTAPPKESSRRKRKRTPEDTRGARAALRFLRELRATSRLSNKPGGRVCRPKTAQQQRCHLARDGRVVRRTTRSAHAQRAANTGP